nr:hypothetical protein [Tanacetum cinerariifolium]
MLDTLGMRNVIDSDEEWPTVGWETIAKANPTILVIARMDRRRFPADDHEKKLAFLKSDPRRAGAGNHGGRCDRRDVDQPACHRSGVGEQAVGRRLPGGSHRRRRCLELPPDPR